MNKRNKKKRIAPAPGMEVTRTADVSPVNIYDIPLERLHIIEWHPDTAAKLPAEQVHFLIVLDEKTKIGLRFQSPDTLGFIIEELIARRKRVWPDAEPVDPDAEVKGNDCEYRAGLDDRMPPRE